MGKSGFHGAFVLNRRVDLHAIDATSARWRGGAVSQTLTARLSQHGRVVAKKGVCEESSGAPGSLVDYTQVRNKPPSLAMGERLEQAIASLKACRAAPSLPENKQKEVDIALKAAKDYQLRTCEACKQQ